MEKSKSKQQCYIISVKALSFVCVFVMDEKEVMKLDLHRSQALLSA